MDACEEFRKLLLETRNANANKRQVSLKLCSLLVEERGLLRFIQSTLDLDESSQRATTHLQRFHATATIVARMPALSVSESEYFQRLAAQLFDILKLNPRQNAEITEKLWKIAAFICIELNERNTKLTDVHIIEPIANAMQNKHFEQHRLTVKNSLLITNRLVICKFPLSKLFRLFSNLFYIHSKLMKTQSHLKTPVENTLAAFVSSNIRIVYLLENTIFNEHYLYDMFSAKTVTICDEITVDFEFDGEQKNEIEPNLAKIDDIAQAAIGLIEKSSEDFKIEFFLRLMDRMLLSSSPFFKLLLYALIDSLQPSVSNVILNKPSKSIQFVVSNLDRITNTFHSELFDFKEPFSADKEHESKCLDEVLTASLNVSLEIVSQLIDSNKKLNEEDKSLLNYCITSLEKIIDLFANEEIKCVAKNLKSKIMQLNEKKLSSESLECSEVQEAISSLNDSSLPVRAHGLILLRRLVLSKNESVMKEKQRLWINVEACLSDKESYIYLAAIRTLAAFAVVATDDVLPVLLRAFHDKSRTIQERVNIGEVLIFLSKDIGQMANHYSKSFVDAFLRGTKDEDPTIRMSSLSNLGQFCAVLNFGISPYIIEIFHCVKCILQTDPFLEVKRASIMFIHLMLNGMDKNTIKAIETEILSIYRLLKQVYNTTLDDVLQLHCQLGIEQIDRIAKELLTMNTDNLKRIQII
ncbi:transport and Golgi organization protein 6-like protein [Dinothrombium tinctorium]|uniref:Transport and Golgi organization protein 6-like protein n=1 Tax=Dinothrombium tinctorium TaxID=1965070 RepID=A0A443QZJ3_9ACAR|nr:transport and Golgi organization protein 6-like protein [Dinothrombium tinctorium]